MRKNMKMLSPFLLSRLLPRRLCTSANCDSPLSLYTAVTFYHFFQPSASMEILQPIQQSLKQLLEKRSIRGTILLANEGINGQLAVPNGSELSLFNEIRSTDGLLDSVDFNEGRTILIDEGSPQTHPYKKTVVKLKSQVLTDGLVKALDCLDAGPELSPQEWHEELTADNRTSLLLDCRNSYESEKGTFSGALPLNTTSFSDSWAVLDKLLENVPRDKRILTFCTGGIRCVKVNAYLKQKLGMTNVGRLKKGIVAYERWREESQLNSTESNETIFIGENFVFDRTRSSNITMG